MTSLTVIIIRTQIGTFRSRIWTLANLFLIVRSRVSKTGGGRANLDMRQLGDYCGGDGNKSGLEVHGAVNGSA